MERNGYLDSLRDWSILMKSRLKKDLWQTTIKTFLMNFSSQTAELEYDVW